MPAPEFIQVSPCILRSKNARGWGLCRRCHLFRWFTGNPTLYGRCFGDATRKAMDEADVERWKRVGTHGKN